MGVVAHHRPKDHLVVRTLGPAESAGHPGLHEYGRPLQVPRRRGEARIRQVGIEDAFRVLRDRQHLAREEATEARILRRGLIHVRDVHQLVVRPRADALARTECLEGSVLGRDVERQPVPGQDTRRSAAIIGAVQHPDRHLPVRDKRGPGLP